MEPQNILERFAAFSGLTGEALSACSPLCAEAAAEVSRQRGSAEGGCAALAAYAAAAPFLAGCGVAFRQVSP